MYIAEHIIDTLEFISMNILPKEVNYLYKPVIRQHTKI